MTGRQLGEAIRAGRRVYGTLIVSTSPHWVRQVGTLGLDFVFIDTEHVPIDRATLAWMCNAYRAIGLPPIVRIPAPDPHGACMALDAGACGILAPYVETPEQVAELRGAVKFRPLKGELLARALAGEPLPRRLSEYIRKNTEQNLLFVNVESVPAMERLDELLAVSGVDGAVIGPHDLSSSLGIPEEYGHPRFDEAVRTIIAACRAAGVASGAHISHEGGTEQEIAWARAGATLMFHSGDISLFARAMRQDLEQMRSALGDEPAAPETASEVIV